MKKAFDLTIKPANDRLGAMLQRHADERGIDLFVHIKNLREVQQSAPYGRCILDGLALSKSDTIIPNMHDNCAIEHYE